ncbi:ATP-binding cassette domain-containing protein [Amycolatopsis albispora]|uniref:ABC transporter n=1 Tax=Amycolatopsis albispora TaxID=1804986 RepID=A0A344L5H8_9PSEU|nr:ATP-binding cassette domain-containing protein [Amycolatopsis albispora]AXB43302.1 ABC transporter [Amycolatopsis albispora]
MNSTLPAIVATGLRKRYRETVALDGFDLSVTRGTVCGLLGPNGAGKTTAVRILATLLRLDSGSASVAGFDVGREPEQVRYRIGLCGQHSAVDNILTGRDNLVMFGRLCHLSPKAARRRADELLEQFGLTHVATLPPKQYSGGMRRRLDLAASLLVTPEVLFLDEPTTGLDPRNRNEVWAEIRAVAASGGTVLLTTQYLDEADQLAGQIAVMNGGRVVAEGSPSELKARIDEDQVDLVLRDPGDLPRARELLELVTGGTAVADPEARRLRAPVRDGAYGLAEAARALAGAGIAVEDIGLRRPTLDEVFLRLTEKRAEELAR